MYSSLIVLRASIVSELKVRPTTSAIDAALIKSATISHFLYLFMAIYLDFLF